MYDDPDIPLVWKRLIRETGRRRYAVVGKWHGTDREPMGVFGRTRGGDSSFRGVPLRDDSSQIASSRNVQRNRLAGIPCGLALAGIACDCLGRLSGGARQAFAVTQGICLI